ncbi:MAG: type II secretion system protein [Patescibacteria group bacterium]
MNQRGFTVIELLALSVLLIIVGVVFWTQKTAIETSARDDERKTSINALYYGLEEVYYPTNKQYPKTLTAATLPSVDPNLFKDPSEVQLGNAESDLSYEGKNCTGDTCKSYTLRTTLDNEADYVKESRNR